MKLTKKLFTLIDFTVTCKPQNLSWHNVYNETFRKVSLGMIITRGRTTFTRVAQHCKCKCKYDCIAPDFPLRYFLDPPLYID